MNLKGYFEFVATPKIIYGPGSIKQMGRSAAKLGCKKPFLVIDRIFVDRGLDKTIEEVLKSAGMECAGMLTDIPPDSDKAVIQQGYDAASAAGADAVAALGGGSTIDTGKGLRVMLGMDGVLPEGVNVITKPLPPMIAIPTTAGTGSECTSAAVIRDKERGVKISYTDQNLAPTLAVLDPELTRTMPAAITAGTGMDALSHCIEALQSINNQLISDGLALQAIRLITRSLPKAVADGNDMEARGEMLLAATMAGLAFSNTLVGLTHAAAHSVGATYRMPHGTACGLFLPFAMEFNIDVAGDVYALAAQAMGIDTKDMTPLEAARAAVIEIRKLHVSLGLPKSLADAGVPEEGVETIAKKAIVDGALITNPKQPTEIQMKTFIKKAWLGAEPCGGVAPAVEHEKKAAAAAAAAPPPAEKEPEQEEEAAPQVTVEEMRETIRTFSGKLFTLPEVVEPLQKSKIKIRFVYFNENWGDEQVVLTADCGQDPIKVDIGDTDIEPIVTMRMHSETARAFWLQKLNLMAAVTKGDIAVEGSLNEAMALLPAIRPGFAMFKEIDEQA